MTTKALRKQLVAAIAMVLVAAVALGSSTYAWFAMNTTVTASNMQVKAKADNGILINEVATYNSSTWDESATTTQSEGTLLRATSTADTKTWYKANSKKQSSSASATQGAPSPDLVGSYTTLTLASTTAISAVAGSTAKQDVAYVDDNGTSGYQSGEGYYAKYTYYLKSSAEAITCSTDANSQNLNISSVTVTGNTAAGGAGAGEIDKALRVAVVLGGKAYIYAPVSGATSPYYVNASATATTPLTGAQATALTSIPASTADGTPVDIYLYFEGEDAGIKTDNVVSDLDDLTVSVQFSLVDIGSTAATDNGVTIPTTP